MNDQDKLKAVIERAVEGGWELPNEAWEYEVQSDRILILTSMGLDDEGHEVPGSWRVSTYEILFSHEFSKAFWGEELVCDNCGELVQWDDDSRWCSGFCADKYRPREDMYEWAFHLQQAVLSESPLDYYFNHLKDEATL